MSTAELKQMVDKTTPDERMFSQAYLDHLARVNDPANAADLSRRMAEMDAGKKITLTLDGLGRLCPNLNKSKDWLTSVTPMPSNFTDRSP